MGKINLAVTAPHATAYDEDYPTRSTENYSHALHYFLQAMEDATGSWYLSDGCLLSTEQITLKDFLHDIIEAVFDYAEGAIDTYRDTGTATLAKPTTALLDTPGLVFYKDIAAYQWKIWGEAMKICYFIYYMWKTEEDPLLLKEKLQELLIAWPLLDTTIELSSELGQQFKVYPSWKNADLDL